MDIRKTDFDYLASIYECFEYGYMEWDDVPADFKEKILACAIYKCTGYERWEYMTEHTIESVPGFFADYLLNKTQETMERFVEAQVEGAFEYAKNHLEDDFYNAKLIWKESKKMDAIIEKEADAKIRRMENQNAA